MKEDMQTIAIIAVGVYAFSKLEPALKDINSIVNTGADVVTKTSSIVNKTAALYWDINPLSRIEQDFYQARDQIWSWFK